MKNLITVVAALGVASYVYASEDKNGTRSLNATTIPKSSADEVHSETLHLPTYVVAENAHLIDTTGQYIAVRPETPVYSSVYAGKSSSPYLRQEEYVDNYIDHEYNSILGLTKNIPGIPGTDYPLYAFIPYTGFSCQEVSPGFYADVLAGCQVWHYCQPDGRHDAFLCPNGTIFDQKNRVCNWWYNVRCQESHYWYAINDDLYRVPKKKYIPAPYYDHYFSPSKVVETKTKPPDTEKPAVNKQLKFHPAIIVKIPKQTYRHLGNEKLQQAASETDSMLIPAEIQNKKPVAKSSPKI